MLYDDVAGALMSLSNSSRMSSLIMSGLVATTVVESASHHLMVMVSFMQRSMSSALFLEVVLLVPEHVSV